jgi:deoxyribodipyrimidine photo-lyase
MVYKNGLFIFRRDLRIIDNTSLNQASKECENIYTIFIFTPEQVSNKNSYKSSNAIQFMLNSLEELSDEIKSRKSKLHFYYGDNEDIIKKIIKLMDIESLYINKDYTPYAIERDKKIKNLCEKNDVKFNDYSDVTLLDNFENIVTKNGSKYFFYTHFRNNAKKTPVRESIKTYPKGLTKINKKIKEEINNPHEYLLSKKYYEENKDILSNGGRSEGKKILKNLSDFKKYTSTRNNPNLKTTMLSPHNHFGTVSIREVYESIKDSLGKNHPLIDQLYWRDFYYYLGDHYKEMYKGKPIPAKDKYSKIKWENNTTHFNKWKEGKTGFPIVDAGMREMNSTGFMHNRVRMIVSMFLIKDLIIDWRKGEKYFSQKLTDIDRTQNVGNWMWSASTGADGQPWLRIFNPWTQGEKADPKAEYIKQWIPELKDVPAKDIHSWHKKYTKYNDIDYFEPIVDHDIQRKKALKAYGEN